MRTEITFFKRTSITAKTCTVLGGSVFSIAVALKQSGIGLFIHKRLIEFSPSRFSGPLFPYVAGMGTVVGVGGYFVGKAVLKWRKTAEIIAKFSPIEIEIA